MELHKSLYKGNPNVLTPRQTNRHNRELLNAKRAKQRYDMYTSSRNISLSPSPGRREPRISATSTPAAALRLYEHHELNATATVSTALRGVADDKENVPAGQPCHELDKTELYASRIARAACTRDPKKLSRQEAYLMRFIEWKEKRKEMEQQLKKKTAHKTRPFVPAGNCGHTFAPKNHQFRAPEGLRNPAKEGTLAVKSSSSSRKSFYAPMPTPPRKQAPELTKKRQPISQLAHTQKRIITKPKTTTTTTTFLPDAKPATKEKFQKKPTPIAIVRPTKIQPPKRAAPVATATKPAPIAAKPKAVTRSQAASSAKTNHVNAAKPAKKSPILTRTRTRQLMPPPPPAAAVKMARIVKPIRGGGAGGGGDSNSASSGAVKKAKSLQNKREAAASTELAHKPSKLSVTMKAKKPVGTNRALARVAAQGADTLKRHVYGMNFLNLPRDALPVLETPTEFAGKNPFAPTITSTNLKALPTDFDALLETSHTAPSGDVEVVEKRPLSAKRELLLNGESKATKSKFNFIRYSEANTEFDINETSPVKLVEITVKDEPKDEPKEEPKDEPKEEPKDEPKEEPHEECIAQEASDNPANSPQITPKRDENLERPSNYLSPFVSVSRGKVNARIEKVKRNSIYLNEPPSDAVSATTPERGDNQPPPATTPVEVRRTLEAVLYFRKQLRDTIERLHAQCDEWDVYRDVNVQRLQETNGEDMINVTIGQTKLLTSKKFMQFKGLIDRCEAQARGEAPPDDGSEATKLITSVDLEGFWSMLGIQVDNLDKRFENLQRWKANDWNDPDEVVATVAAKPIPKVKKTLSKVKKTKAEADTKKAKPSSALVQMMRKMHAEMRKNKAQVVQNGDDVPVAEQFSDTPNDIPSERPSTPNSSPRRTSYILVRDRKSFSKAPTVLRVTPQRSTQLQKHLHEFKNSLAQLEGALESDDVSLLKTALMGAEQKRRFSTMIKVQSPRANAAGTPVLLKGRKSILKTPGTAKSHRKSVVFENRVKQLKFTINDTDEDSGSGSDDANDNEDGGASTQFQSEVYQELKRDKEYKEEEEKSIDGRSYRLRTRKVALRPSCEIVIPKKSL